MFQFIIDILKNRQQTHLKSISYNENGAYLHNEETVVIPKQSLGEHPVQLK